MYKLKKLYSFHISRLEEDAISEIRKYNINVSQYLRESLRDLVKELRSKESEIDANRELTGQVISNLLLWLRKEGLS